MAKKYQSVFEQLENQKKNTSANSTIAASPNIAVNTRMQEEREREDRRKAAENKNSGLASSTYASVFSDLGIIGNVNKANPLNLTFPSDITDETYYPGKNSTGNPTLDSFLIYNQNQKNKEEAANRQQEMQKAMSDAWLDRMKGIGTSGGTPVTTATTPETTSKTNRENQTAGNGKTGILGAINYANARGAQALDAFNTNLNVLGQQAAAAINAAVDTVKNTRGKNRTAQLPSLLQNKKPTLVSSTAGERGITTPEEINQTSGASEGFGGQLKNNIREANTAVLESAAKENRNALAREEVDKEFPVSDNKVVKALGDLTAAVSGMAPSVAVSTATGVLAGAALRGGTSSVDAYIEARNEGASTAQAKKYASREAVNQGIGDILLTGLGGVGSSALGQLTASTKVGRQLAKAYGTTVTAPGAKTAIRYLGNMLGEGVEEAIQNAVTVANKQISYNRDAKVNPREMLYEGVLGAATAGVFGAVNIPQNYRVYRSDVDTVNDFSKAAANVTSDADVDLVNLNGNILIDWCNFTISDPSVDFDTRARSEYIKAGVQSAMDEMNANRRNIIEYNAAFDEAVDFAADAPIDDIIFETANIVTVVGENTDPGDDVIRATIDKLNEEKRNIYNEQTLNAVTNQMKQELEMRRRILDVIEQTLRNQKTDVKNTVAGLLEAPKNLLPSVTESDIIGVDNNTAVTAQPEIGNPVMIADGKSLFPTDNTTVSEGENKYNLVHKEYEHTKTHETMHLFTIDKNLSGEDYTALKNAIKEVGGYWSKFAKGFVVPEDGLSRLPDVLGNIGVGIDESQYTPTAQTTAQTEGTVQNVPQIEVLESNGAETTTRERGEIPTIETTPTGGEVVPVGEQAVTGTEAETNLEVPGAENYGQNNGQTADTTRTAPDTGNIAGVESNPNTRTPVNVRPENDEEDRKRVNPAWRDSVNAISDKWKGIAKKDISGALDELYDAMDGVYEKFSGGSLTVKDSADENSLLQVATTLASDLVDSASVWENNPEYYTHQQARKYLRETPIVYDRDKMIEELGDKPSFKRWRDSLRGNLKLTTDATNGNPVDTIFNEFADNYPGYVDLTLMNETDQLNELARVAISLRGEAKNSRNAVNPFDMDRDTATNGLMTELLQASLNRFMGVKPQNNTTESQNQNKTQKAENAVAASAYDELSHDLASRETVTKGDFIFKIQADGLGHYSGTIQRTPKINAYGIPIENARDVLFNTGWENIKRGDMVERLVEVAQNNKLLDPVEAPKTETNKISETKQEPEAAETAVAEPEEDTAVETKPYTEIADWVLDRLNRGLDIQKKDLQVVSNNAYGGTQAEGAYTVKDMTDALELGVNRYIIQEVSDNTEKYVSPDAKTTASALDFIDDHILAKIPTQTGRTEEQEQMQQFSTPPNIAYIANWAANITPDDTMLEPSAGIGGLASFAKGMGAKVVVNELSERRSSLLKTLPFDGFYNENAEQIDNILPSSIKPTVVVMNPPFSANGRTKNKTANAIPHIEQALDRLENGGRLVAILGGGREAGQGMSDNAPAFKSWWNGLRNDYSIRANIGIDGSNYKKYGTSFNVRLVVIDKTGAQTEPTLTGEYKDLTEAINDLEEIRNDRTRGTAQANVENERNGAVKGGGSTAESGTKTGGQRGTDSGKRSSDSGKANAGGRENGGEQPLSDLSADRGGEPSERVGLESEESESEVRVSDGERESGGRRERGSDAGTPSNSERGESDRSGGVDTRKSGADVDRESPVMVQTGTGVSGAAGEVLTDERGKKTRKAAENDDGVYASYRTSTLRVKGAKSHPAKLVESSAMSAVPSPPLKYKPTLDQAKIDAAVWSDAQLEAISYAGQAHSEKLPDGRRKGFFDGDGTGVGKGRQIAGIIMDNFNQGRKRAIWISENFGLMEDAKRDWKDVGGDDAEIFPFTDAKKKKGLPSSGIMFISYDTLRTKSQKTGITNLDLVEEWFGKDFDGVIVFDEAHNMGNLTPVKGLRGSKKPAAKAIAGDKLQNDLPNARVSYFSATGATNIENLSYASRLGLWGEGTSFENANDFVTKIGSAGISAMELVARDMKAMGVYLARSISYDGVKYDNVDHKLTKAQIAMYNRMSEGWQVVLQNFDKAMQLTDSQNSSDVKRQRGMIYTNMQQFYNQVLTSMAMPSVIKDIEKELSAGHSCVIQLVNTNEAAQDREIKKAKESGEELDSLDITPRQLLVGYVENSFPVQQYEEYLDENGNKQSRPVVDSAGNPVINRKAQAMKEDLIADLNEISIPEGPLDLLINHFGTKQVAEVTGRSQRVVNQEDENGNVKKVVERRDSKKANIAEAAAFQNGDKRILVFSNAGSTGRSFHADKRAKNQQQRIHYVLQPGWRADKAVQGFGRTHRSNQVSAPVFRLVSTDVKGHKRFVTSIARRLDQLGALTKGQRQTGSGVFGEKDNLESPLSAEALHSFYRKLGTGMFPDLDPKDVLQRMGLYEKFYDEFDNFSADTSVASEITTFLNRLLALPVEEQNQVFDAFEAERDRFYTQAIESGTLDRGLENVKADKVEIEQEEVVYTDEKTGAETKYVKAKIYNKPRVVTTVAAAQDVYAGFTGVFRLPDGSVRAAYRLADTTDARTGEVVKRYLLVGPNQGKASRYVEATLKRTCTEVPKKEWQEAWDEELTRVPEYNEGEVHMITGALLPVWNKLPMDGNIKAQRITAADGTQYLGRVIGKSAIDGVLRGLNVSVKKETYTGKQLYDAVMKDGKIVTMNGTYGGVFTIARRRVSGENRIEITGAGTYSLKNDYPDIIQETIQYVRRYFIPSGKKGEGILETLSKRNGVRSVSSDENDGDMYSAGLSHGKWGKGRRDRDAQVPSISTLVDEAQRIFGVPINVGKVGQKNAEGVFKTHAGTIRTKQYGDLPTIGHELGHWFDQRYNLNESPFIDSLTAEYGEELTEAGYQPSMFKRESVAEFFSDYLSDREATEKKFRAFTDWMYQKLSDRDQRKLFDYAGMTNAYFAADLDRRASAQIHYRTDGNTILSRTQANLDEATRNPRDFFGDLSRSFVRNWFDDLVDLRGFGQTYDLAYREKQARSIAYGRLTSAMTNKNGNVIGKSLAAILEEGNITEQNARDFDAYLIANIALDRYEAAANGENIATLVYGDEELQKPENIADRIVQLERDNPTFRETANGVYEYERQLMNIAVDSGLVSADLAEKLNELYPHYVPLYRVMDDKETRTRGARRGYANQSTPIARFKGSARDIWSPIENIISNTEKFTVAAMRNDVMQEFADFIDQNEDMGWAAEKIPQSKIYDKISTDELAKKINSFARSTDKLDSMSDKEKVDFYSSLMSFIGDTLGQWKPATKQGANVVSVMRDGKHEYYEVHDKGLYKALTNMDAPQFGIITKYFGTATRINKWFYTSSNPQFLFTNPQRDLVTGFISSTTTNNPFTYLRDFFAAFGNAVGNTEVYQEYLRGGGGYMGSVTADINVLKRVKKDVYDENRSNIKRFMDTVTSGIPRLVDAGETASRLAEWKRAVAQGDDMVDALRKSQEITVNFARGGRIVKSINQFIPFFQAGFSAISHNYDLFVNGADGGGGRNGGGNGYGLNLTPEAKRRRANAWAKWLLTTGMLALLTWLYNYLLAPRIFGESEEEVKQKADDLSNYNKNAYYNLYIGDGKFFRIKKTQDMSVPATVVERMVEYTVLDQKDSLYELTDNVFANILPVDSLHPMDIASEISVLGTFVDLARNEDFKGTPIVSSRYQYLPKTEQYTESTSTIAISLGRALNMSPIQLQYAAEDNFGWAARLINNLFPYNGERSLGLKTKLIADSAYSTDIINIFYDKKDDYDKASKAYKANPVTDRYSLEDVYGAYKYDKVADLYSSLNTMTRNESDNDLSRDMRIKTNALIQTVNENGISVLDQAVIDLAENTSTDITSIAPYVAIPDSVTYTNGKYKEKFALDYDDMYEYYTQSQTAFENAYGRILEAGFDDATTAAAMVEAKKVIQKSLRDAWEQELFARKYRK